MDKRYKEYSYFALRVVIGALFIVPGISKLFNLEGITGFFISLGLPAAEAMVWLVLVCEIVFGLAVIAGWRVKYSVWPLVVIMVVALATAVIPQALKSSMAWTSVLFHLLAIAVLVYISANGPGKWGLKTG